MGLTCAKRKKMNRRKKKRMATFNTKPKAKQQQKENDFRGKPAKQRQL